LGHRAQVGAPEIGGPVQSDAEERLVELGIVGGNRRVDVVAGAAYRDLVQNRRRVAGVARNQAWATPAIETDDQMNIPREKVDLAELATFERYSDAR
jgi:hypothetical protein